MLMRKKPERGEKVLLKDGRTVTALESEGKEFFRVLNEQEKIESVHRNLLVLPIINTKYYEKLDDSAA